MNILILSEWMASAGVDGGDRGITDDTTSPREWPSSPVGIDAWAFQVQLIDGSILQPVDVETGERSLAVGMCPGSSGPSAGYG